MRKRNLKKTILAAALAVPVAFSYSGWAVRAQEDGEMSAEIETQEIIQDNIESEEAEYEENPDSDEMDGTETDQDVSEEEEVFQTKEEARL